MFHIRTPRPTKVGAHDSPSSSPASSLVFVSDTMESLKDEYDVVVIGAGISGIGAAYHLQAMCPHTSFVVLESR